MKSLNLRLVCILSGVLAIFMFNKIKAQDLNSATLLTRSEQYDKAQAIFEQLIQKEPANSKNYFYYGENYLLDYFADTISNSLTVSLNAAKELYDKGIKANPNDPLNYTGLARVAFYLDDNKTADEMRTKARSFLLPYKNIKKISPPAKDYAFTLAKIAESYIKYDEVDTSLALPLVRQAIKIDSKNRDIYLIAGDIYMLVNDGTNAIMNYNLAQYADPKSSTANMKIGNVYVRGHSLPAAIAAYEEAIKLNESYAPAYRELGQLYWSANRYEQSKENYKKYLELTAGNIPAKTRYVNSLFYAKDYEEVIKNVEEILTVDKSQTYFNRLAGYSYFEKTPPDYNKAYTYMEELFRIVAPERIFWKDNYYMARILVKKNQNYPKMADELSNLEAQLDKEKIRYSTTANAAEKAKIKVNVDGLTGKVSGLKTDLEKVNAEIDRAFVEYGKVLKVRPQDRALLNEMAVAYSSFRRYESVAKTLTKMIDPKNEKIDDYLQIGRAYYNGENYKTADSVFNIVIKKSPDYVPGYVSIARTYAKMDPDLKAGLAKPKFEKVLEKAKVDSVKYAGDIMEACGYLGYYHMTNDNYNEARDYYNRMINLDANNKDNKIKGYNGLGSLDYGQAGKEKTIEGRLPYLAKSKDSFSKALALDQSNATAKNMLKMVQDFEAAVKKGINPNEIKGIVKNTEGQPIPYASVSVKNTAVENLTNQKGEYKFEIPQASDILVISAKGYKSQEIAISKTVRIYNVTLEK
jgi:tetratricopeptide (TPR) repeat protein